MNVLQPLYPCCAENRRLISHHLLRLRTPDSSLVASAAQSTRYRFVSSREMRTLVTSVRRILVRGVNAPVPPEAKKILSPPPPSGIQKTALFACFRFLIFHPFSRGVICPYVRTPMTLVHSVTSARRLTESVATSELSPDVGAAAASGLLWSGL